MSIAHWIARLSLVAVALVAGCTATISPPHDPLEPTKVIVLAEAMHRGLLLPSVEGGFVEYGFGDWDWYAMGDDAWYRVLPVLLWPTTGTVCRREHQGRDLLEVKERMPWVRLQELKVPTAKVLALRERLEQAFAAGETVSVWQAAYSMRFVPCARGYWWASNCTDQVADWLTELGCDVSWVPICIDLVVR